jgi:hypothetical protein
MMATHKIKILPVYFDAVISGIKPFEVRKDDRGYAVGDTLLLREWKRGPFPSFEGDYTGRECERVVTYILSGAEFGLHPNIVVMGIIDPLKKDGEIARLRGALKKIERDYDDPAYV